MSSVILNFHGVGRVPRDLDDGERHCWLDQDFFEAVLDLVRDQSHVRLTADDGNASDVEVVLPALLRRGLQAVFFICSGRLDQAAFLSSHQVRELLAHGMGIGSHGVQHRSWRHLSGGQLKEELDASRRVLESVCRAPVESAACPFGDYDRHVIRGLRQAGYRSVFTSDGGVSDAGGWLQPRTTVNRSMTLADVQRLIHRGWSVREQWLINCRKLVKRLR